MKNLRFLLAVVFLLFISACNSRAQTYKMVPNDGTTGTTQFTLTKIAAGNAIIMSTSDTSGYAGVCVLGCGTTGTATLQTGGAVRLLMSNASTAQDYVQISSVTGGDGLDVGATFPAAGGDVIGRVQIGASAAATALVDLFPSEISVGNPNLNFGYPVIGGGLGPVKTSPVWIDAAIQAGSDFCAKLIAAMTESGNNNATIDARGFVGSQTCSSNPFVNLSSTGADANLTILLPCEIITTTAGWVIPQINGVWLKGSCGKNGNSVLKASGASYPANTALISVGVTGHTVFSDMITDWRLDCSNAVANSGGTGASQNCQPYVSYGINEHSGLDTVAILGQNSSGNTVPCVSVGDTAAGSAPGHFTFKNVDIDRCGPNDFVQIFADGAAMGHFQDITCNSTGFLTGVVCLHFQDSFGSGHSMNAGALRNIHGEGQTYTIEFDTATFGEVDTADCTGTCSGVLLVNTVYGVVAHDLASVSGSANIVSNTNGQAVGVLTITDATAPQVQLYAQSTAVAAVNHTMAYYNGGFFSDIMTDSGLTAGDCVQAGTGGKLTTVSAGCIAVNGVTAGDIVYFNGTSWVLLSGNASGTKYLSETSAGVPSWAVSSGIPNIPGWLTYFGDGSDGAVTISSSQALTGVKYPTTWTCSGTTVITVNSTGPLIIRASTSITVGASCSIVASSQSTKSGDMGATGGGGGGGTAAGAVGSGSYAYYNGALSTATSAGGTAGASSGGTGGGGNAPSSGLLRSYLDTGFLAPEVNWACGAPGGTGGSSGGAGGAGGGCIILIAPSITLGSGTALTASGAAGTNSAANNTGSGGGGGGGVIIVRSPNLTDNGATFSVAGGAGGTCGAFTGCGAGGAGGTGWFREISQ